MTPPRIFRLFVSSTFSDFIEEREWLKEKVFPDLEEYCAEAGARFQAVDLRWGITEAAQQNNETIQICLDEVRRCQELSPRPNFAVLLGHRYGWEPIPEIIPESHWYRLITELDAQGTTEDTETMNSLYKRDSNAVPPVYCLASEVTKKQTSKIQRILRSAAANFTGADRLPYFGSATHQEIALGALGVDDAEEHVHAYIRRIKHLPNDANAKGYIDWEDGQQVPGANQRLNQLEAELRNRLAEDHVHEFECTWIKKATNESDDKDREKKNDHGNKKNSSITLDHLQSFGDSFYRHQVALIDQELARIKKVESLKSPNKKHRRFAEERTEFFVGRDSMLNQIADYLNTSLTPQSPFIAVAEGGSGKTSIIAKSYLQACEGSASNRNSVVLCRFIGGVTGVENLKSLLNSLISEIQSAYGLDRATTLHTVKETAIAFEEALNSATQECPLWIFIDALDQLDQANNLPLSDWLPQALPDSVRIVLSARPEALANSQGFTTQPIPPMRRQEGDRLLSLWLSSSREASFSAGITPTSDRTLTTEQRKLLLKPFADTKNTEHGNPLWLKLAYEEARRWRSWHQSDKDLNAFPETVEGMVQKFIDTYLIKQRKHPPVFVRKALSYLTAGRYGLSEEELGHALGTDPEVRIEFKNLEKTDKKWSCGESLPPIFWSRLAFDLKPYLTTAFIDGALVYRYFHREFTAAIEKSILGGQQKEGLHAHLAKEVFSRPEATSLYQDTDASKETQVSQTMRRIMEQPWQLASAKQGEQLGKLLTHFSFCMAKCAANRSEDLIQDFKRAEDLDSVTNYKWHHWFDFFVGRVANLLTYATDTWPAHRILCQLAIEHSDNSSVTQAAESWLEINKTDWQLNYLAPRPKKTRLSGCRSIMPGHKGPVIGVEIIDNFRLLSWASNELRIWNFRTGSCLLASSELPSPIHAAKRVSDDSILCISGQEQYLVSLNTGRISKQVTENEASSLLKETDLEEYFAEKVYRRELVQIGNSFELTKHDLDDEVSARAEIADGFDDSCKHAEYLSDGRILSYYKDGTLRVWEKFQGGLISELRGHTSDTVRTAMLRDGRLLSWDDTEGQVRVWSIQLNTMRTTKNWDPQTSQAMIMSDGRILSWSASGRAVVWDSTLTTKISILDGHTDTIRGVKSMEDGSLITYSEDGSIRHWRPIRNALYSTNEGHRPSSGLTPLRAIELPDGNVLSWAWKELIFWNGSDATLLSKLEVPTEIMGVKALSDGQILIWGYDRIIRKTNKIDSEFIKIKDAMLIGIEELVKERILAVYKFDRNSHELEFYDFSGKAITGIRKEKLRESIKEDQESIFKKYSPLKDRKAPHIYDHIGTQKTVILNPTDSFDKVKLGNKICKNITAKSLTIISGEKTESVLFSDSARAMLVLKNGSIFIFEGLHRLNAKILKPYPHTD